MIDSPYPDGEHLLPPGSDPLFDVLQPGQRVADEDAKHASMARCIVCSFVVDADDVRLDHGDGRCICVRCYAAAVGASKPMPKELRTEIQRLLEEVA